jgi:hypothetical protein
VKSVLRALCEGIHFVLTDWPATEHAITRWARIDDPQELDAAYHASVDTLQRQPYPSLAVIQAVIDAAALQAPEARTLTPEQLVDDTLLCELEADGFVDALWR